MNYGAQRHGSPGALPSVREHKRNDPERAAICQAISAR